MTAHVLGLFEAYGIEIEYALVDGESLDVRSIADRVLRERTGTWAGDAEDGPVGWSNELVLHQIELKTAAPTPDLAVAAADLQASVLRLDALAGRHGARLLPGAMHPWMVPALEARLWPHEYAEVYATYDRLFDCRRHGWANVQATHLNLPFASDDELGRLLAAVRLVLPLVPALAAASPFREGAATGTLDLRLDAYRSNAARVPAMTGAVIPEPVYDRESYEREVLEPLYAALRPLDPEGTLQQEFANARGAIVRFDRDALEVRLIDVQEHPAADLAVCAAIAAVVRSLCEERWSSAADQRACPSAPLVALLREAEVAGPATRIDDPGLLALLGHDPAGPMTLGDLWRRLADEVVLPALAPALAAPLQRILDEGTLAERILRAAGARPDRARLRAVYGELADCLRAGRSFLPEAAPLATPSGGAEVP